MLAKPQGFPRKLGGCAGLDPRLRSAVSAGVGDGERGLRRGLRAPGVGVRPKWVLEYPPSKQKNKVLCFNYLCAHRPLDCPQILRRRQKKQSCNLLYASARSKFCYERVLRAIPS